MQIQVDYEDLLIFLNSTDISSTIQEVDDIYMESEVVTLQRSLEDSIDVSFVNGISLTVSQSSGLLSFLIKVPLELHKMASGLLGNFNEDPSDDFTLRDGTMLEAGSSEEEIYDFGQSCKHKINTVKSAHP